LSIQIHPSFSISPYSFFLLSPSYSAYNHLSFYKIGLSSGPANGEQPTSAGLDPVHSLQRCLGARIQLAVWMQPSCATYKGWLGVQKKYSKNVGCGGVNTDNQCKGHASKRE
jgi:hypothetical protein